jgi:bifunctional polynucleotide phosphatase/kinase
MQSKKKVKGGTAKRTWTWNEESDDIIWGQTDDFVGGEKVAMFDMDGNLITTKRGVGFARSADDWKWFDPCVPAKMKEYVASGHVIVIATNQMGISKGKTRPSDIKKKISTFSQEWDCPVAAMMACSDDQYRKPNTGMWDHYRDTMNDGIEISLADSFYVGDAAGRPKTASRKKDHGYGDRGFALNVGISFYTPEMFFLG